MKKTVVVTGGASGIGFATAERFAKGGYNVVLTDMNEERLKEAKAQLVEKYADVQVEAFVSNVTCQQSVNELREKVNAAFGHADALVNCAGVFRGGLIHEAAEDDYEFQFKVNVGGVFHTMKAFIPDMLEQGAGAVVNISSASGTRGDYNCPLYAASKAAVANLTRATAIDYAAQGIRVNCVSPSATRTPMFLNGSTQEVIDAFINALPDHKLGEPRFVAQAIYYLCSDEAEHIIGHVLPVDGGLTEWNGQPRQDKEQA